MKSLILVCCAICIVVGFPHRNKTPGKVPSGNRSPKLTQKDLEKVENVLNQYTELEMNMRKAYVEGCRIASDELSKNGFRRTKNDVKRVTDHVERNLRRFFLWDWIDCAIDFLDCICGGCTPTPKPTTPKPTTTTPKPTTTTPKPTTTTPKPTTKDHAVPTTTTVEPPKTTSSPKPPVTCPPPPKCDEVTCPPKPPCDESSDYYDDDVKVVSYEMFGASSGSSSGDEVSGSFETIRETNRNMEFSNNQREKTRENSWSRYKRSAEELLIDLKDASEEPGSKGNENTDKNQGSSGSKPKSDGSDEAKDVSTTTESASEENNSKGNENTDESQGSSESKPKSDGSDETKDVSRPSEENGSKDNEYTDKNQDSSESEPKSDGSDEAKDISTATEDSDEDKLDSGSNEELPEYITDEEEENSKKYKDDSDDYSDFSDAFYGFSQEFKNKKYKESKWEYNHKGREKTREKTWVRGRRSTVSNEISDFDSADKTDEYSYEETEENHVFGVDVNHSIETWEDTDEYKEPADLCPPMDSPIICPGQTCPPAVNPCFPTTESGSIESTIPLICESGSCETPEPSDSFESISTTEEPNSEEPTSEVETEKPSDLSEEPNSESTTEKVPDTTESKPKTTKARPRKPKPTSEPEDILIHLFDDK